MPIERIAVLVTSFNRRETTLAALASLFRQKGVEKLSVDVFLVDDGCTDGTGDAVRSAFSQVHVLYGDGGLFWNGGMRQAFETAKRGTFDAYVFFNDDTILFEDALFRLVTCANESVARERPAIAVGSTLAAGAKEISYGGLIRVTNGLDLRFKPVLPEEDRVLPCDTMNGNFVLVPAQIAEVVGNLERRFRHQFGDLDYGLRARKAGFALLVVPGYVGQCPGNSRLGTWLDESASLRQRWKKLTSPKGVPLQEWFLFTRRHYGWRFLFYVFSPYLKTIASSVLPHRGAIGRKA